MQSETPPEQTTHGRCSHGVAVGDYCYEEHRTITEADAEPSMQTTLPPGAAIVERIGWEDSEDGKPRFTATLVFPTGAPELSAAVVWKPIPMRLVPWECADGK